MQSDVPIAKNYLSEKDMKRLERDVSSYFEAVERLLEQEHLLSMQDFAKSIDEFLTFSRYEILEGHRKISQKQAKEKAIEEYKAFNKHQKITSGFDEVVKNVVRKRE